MDLNFLKKVSLFSDLTNDELKIVAEKLKTVKCKEGEAVITEKDESDRLYILYSGEVMVSKKMTMIDEEESLDKTFRHQFNTRKWELLTNTNLFNLTS